MRRIMVGIGLIAALISAVGWWQRHRRAGSRFVNEVVNPFLLRHGVAGRSRENLGTLEHIGRRSGTRRLTMVHPVRTDDGFRIIVPLGVESQWARNVLDAGHCRLQVGDTVYELDAPALVEPGSVSEVPAVFRFVQARLGFRWIRLQTFRSAPGTLEKPAGIVQPRQKAPEAAPQPVPSAV